MINAHINVLCHTICLYTYLFIYELLFNAIDGLSTYEQKRKGCREIRLNSGDDQIMSTTGEAGCFSVLSKLEIKAQHLLQHVSK